jgi:hypothetical protein
MAVEMASSENATADSAHQLWQVVPLREARRALSKEVYAEVAWAVNEREFKLRAQGHKYGLYCPCGTNGVWIRVDGSPNGDPVYHAKRVKRLVNHCPEKHGLMR